MTYYIITISQGTLNILANALCLVWLFWWAARGRKGKIYDIIIQRKGGEEDAKY